MTTRAVLLLLLGLAALHSASAVSLSRPGGAQKRRPSVAAAARQLSGPAYGRPTGSSGPANSLVTKLLALPTPRSGVDSVAVERILRTTDGLQGKQLLEVLQALRKQRKWQLMLALGKLLEARATTAAPGAGARRTAEADGASSSLRLRWTVEFSGGGCLSLPPGERRGVLTMIKKFGAARWRSCVILFFLWWRRARCCRVFASFIHTKHTRAPTEVSPTHVPPNPNTPAPQPHPFPYLTSLCPTC